MRNTLLFLITLIPAISHAQLTAGEVPPGATTYDPGIDLSIAAPFTEDSADIELDCDDFADLRAWLHRGAPEIDAPHIAALHFIDNDIEVCMDLQTGFGQRPKYHAFGEALDCSGNYSWQLVDPIILGDLGGFLGTGPEMIDSMYIAFRRGAEIGWMLLSFDLNQDPDLDLEIHELLPLCQIPTSMDERGAKLVVIHPNPSNGGPIQLRVADPIRTIEVIDATGKIIAEYPDGTRSVDAPDVPGVYFARIIDDDGHISVSRFIRY
jgi:hypothetical protein